MKKKKQKCRTGKTGNKKAVGGVLIMMLGTVIGLLVVGSLMIGFAGKFLAHAPGSVQQKICARTLQFKLDTNKAIDEAVEDAHISKPSGGIGKLFSGDNLKRASNWATGDPIGHANTMTEEMADKMKDKIQPICNTIDTTCKGDAAEVSR
ncbi:MAG: hypothetical protein ABIF92_01190, partial [archaeon]